MKFPFRPRFAVVAAAGLCAVANAQFIDQFNVRREGDNAVLQLRFATEVQFQRTVTTRSGDVTLIFYMPVTLANEDLRGSQNWRLGAKQGLPQLDLTDENERGARGRKITLRTPSGTRLHVRAGAGNRSIEIVLEGAGPGVTQAVPLRDAPTSAQAPSGAPPAIVPATLPEADRRFVIVLQSSSEPNLQVATPIPRSLQSYDVFTSERVVDGARRYEIRLGYFSSREQAEAVLRQLTTFPQATIAATGPAPPAEPTPAPAAESTAGAVPIPVPAPPAPAATPGPEPVLLSAAEVELRSDTLLATAQAALSEQNYAGALESLNQLLNLPPNRNTRAAQEMAGIARARSGDVARARIEFETYLQLYPQGEGSDAVRRELAALPAIAPAPTPAAEPARAEVETTVTGSTSMYYYGGNGQIRSQDFKDSPVAGLPQVPGDALFTADKSNQLFNDVDLNWRRRDSESDMRFVVRDSYATDLENSDKSKNRLSALYFDYKSLTGGYNVRLGRQSPTGGGVMGRYDGITGSYLIRPKLKVGAVAGQPTDPYFDSKRRFYGVSLDADGVLPNFGGTVYTLQQTIDSEVDRRALGLELRYFNGGASVFSQFDYDTLIKGLNIATVQGTFITEDGTVFNALYDRRSLAMLALGNALTFEDPSNPGVLFRRIADKLASTTLEALRAQIKGITPYVTQAQVGVTTPLNKTWQIGANAQLTNTGEIPPVPGVVGFENGRPDTGNIYSASGQLIGVNLYSSRDTHVFNTTAISSPSLKGLLVSYNGSSFAWDVWQFEPSLQYYQDHNPEGSTNQRWTPGLRLTYRGWQRWSLESTLTYELGKGSRVSADPTDPTLTVTTHESANRVNYSLGARYEF